MEESPRCDRDYVRVIQDGRPGSNLCGKKDRLVFKAKEKISLEFITDDSGQYAGFMAMFQNGNFHTHLDYL